MRRLPALALTLAAALVPSSAFGEEPSESAPRRSTTARPEHVRVGPLVGIGFPRPLAVEAFAKLERVVGLGLEYSLLPRMNLFGADTSFTALAADLRVFPFRGSFFIGARGGRQWLSARTAIEGEQGSSLGGSMHASTWFLNPRLGFLHTFESGITVGIDAGVQIPIAPSYTETYSSDAAASAGASSGSGQTFASVAGALGNKTTATVDLLRLGFLL